MCNNGYVYFIEKVLNPRDLAPDNTQIEVLKNNGFTTLLKFYEILGLTPEVNIFCKFHLLFCSLNLTLRWATEKTDLPHFFSFCVVTVRYETLFAPTDEAFAALPPGTLESLFANPRALLRNHFISGTFYKYGLVSGPVPTYSGLNVEVEVIPGR